MTTQDFLAFIRTAKRRSNVRTSARIQSFCRKNNINIGYYDGFRMYRRNITEINTTLKRQENHFCLIWKIDGFGSDKAIKEFEDNFIFVDIVISDKHVKGFVKYEFKLKMSNLN